MYYTLSITNTYLINAFLLVHHPSAHRTKTANLPFSTLQWSQTQETLSYTAAQCRRAREERREGGESSEGRERGSGERGGGWRSRRGKCGKRRKWRREKRRREGRHEAAHCCSPDLLSAPPSSSLAFLPLAFPLHLFFSIEGKAAAAARNLCTDKRWQILWICRNKGIWLVAQQGEQYNGWKGPTKHSRINETALKSLGPINNSSSK